MDEDFAGIRRFQTADCLNDLRSARADKTGERNDLALAHGERDILEVTVSAQMTHFKHDIAQLVRSLMHKLHLASHHQGDQCIVIHLVAGTCVDVLTVADDGKHVGNLKQFLQLVADKQHRNILPLQFADDLEQQLNLATGKRGCRLIHDDELRVASQRTSNGDQLLLSRRQRTQLHVDVDIHAQPFQRFLRNRAHLVPVDANSLFLHLFRDRDILRHTQVGKE